MSIIRNVGNLHDDTTGELTGYINPVTNKEEALDATALQALVSGAGSRARYANQVLHAGRPLLVQQWGNSWENNATMWQSFVSASGGRLGYYLNAGVLSERSDQVLARLVASGVDPSAEVCPFGEGTNDATAGVSVATHMANMRQIAQRLIDAGVVPIMRTTPPRSDAVAGAQALTHQYWLAEILTAESMGIIAVDIAARVVETDGTVISAANDGTNIHLNNTYYGICGKDAWTDLAAGTPVKLIPRTNAGQGLTGSNVLQLTSSANRPTGWTTFHGVAFTTLTWQPMTDYAYPYRGKRAIVDIGYASGTGYVQRTDVAMAGQGGKVVRIAGVIKLAAVTNGFTVGEIFFYDGASTLLGSQRIVCLTEVGDDTYVQTDCLVPVGTTKYSLGFRTAGIVAGAVSATLEFGCWDVYAVTDNTY